MKPGVNDHLVSLGKSLGAELAGIRPRVGVDPLVLAHQVAALEALGAEGTLVGPLASVHDPAMEKNQSLPSKLPSFLRYSRFFKKRWAIPSLFFCLFYCTIGR